MQCANNGWVLGKLRPVRSIYHAADEMRDLTVVKGVFSGGRDRSSHY